MHYKKFELKLPLFFGCLGSLALCALMMLWWPLPLENVDVEDQCIVFDAEEDNHTEAGGDHLGYTQFFAQVRPPISDRILELYRQPETQGCVFDFFTGICPSMEITEKILFYADSFDIAPALAFALGWEESRLNPLAVNDKNRDESIDRGLFQLNSYSFPQLEVQAFFNLDVNAYYGMSHLRYCLDTGGTEIAALAMYNAGSGRVRGAGTPKTTLDYVSRVLENRREIDNRFLEWESLLQLQQTPIEDDFSETLVELKPERSRLIPLMPLGVMFGAWSSQ